jgi:signal transduction histidine kinase
MFSDPKISGESPLLAVALAVAVGCISLWSNPKRGTNQRFFLVSMHVSLWLVLLYFALSGRGGASWLRVTAAVGATIFIPLWLLKESILNEDETLAHAVWRARYWLAATAGLAATCYTRYFIPPESTSQAPVFGLGYYVYIGGIVLIYVILSVEVTAQLRQQSGISRMELQIFLLGGSLAAGAILLLMVLRTLLGFSWLIRLQPVVIIAFYATMVVAITTYRIFDARQLILYCARKLVVIALFGGVFYLVFVALRFALPEPLAFFVATGVALGISGWLNRRFPESMFSSYPRDIIARKAAYEAARRGARPDALEETFRGILRQWSQSDHAVILCGTADALDGSGLSVDRNSSELRLLRELRWVTPERLRRERLTPERARLRDFLVSHRLGAAVFEEGPMMGLLVGVGVPFSRQPVTYPQVMQLAELASIIEGALARAQLSVKAQRAEQLATVGLLGASFAHEIRNPLVTIKTFAQLLPDHHGEPEFRSKFFRLIVDEISRIDRLMQQLLDLSAPRSYSSEELELHEVLRSSLEIAAGRASDKSVRIVSEFGASPDRVLTDPSAVKQVILNLAFNAISAAEESDGDRWIRVATRNVADGVEMAVSDSGPGISPEMRARLFQPFQTTKSSGFGLGLAICSDILSGLGTPITVDPSVEGQGATFRVTFPCPRS